MYLAVQMESSSLMIITMGDERGERIDVVVTLSVPLASSHISAQPSNLATILHILQQFNDFEHLQRMHQFYNLHIHTKGHTSYLSFLAVQNSSIGDLVTHSLTVRLTVLLLLTYKE